MSTIEQITKSLQALYAQSQKEKRTYEKQDLLGKLVIAHREVLSQSLLAILQKHAEDTPALCKALTAFLAAEWETIGGTCLQYTTRPREEETLIMCQIATWLRMQMEVVNPGSVPSALELLMPGLSLDSINAAVSAEGRQLYPDLNAVKRISSVLVTHILSRDKQSLIPVTVLSELDLTEASPRIANPYYDYRRATMPIYLEAEEQDRLYHHSRITEAILETKDRYETILNDKRTLLGVFRHFTHELYANSIKGSGTEYAAGQGAYPAIVEFMAYYHDSVVASGLDKRVPVELQDELKRVVRLASDKGANLAGTPDGETCVFLWRGRFERLIDKYASVLDGLSISDAGVREARIDEAQRAFQTAKSGLQASLLTGDYREELGFDKQSNIPLSLVDSIFSIERLSAEDRVSLINYLSPEDLDVFLKTKGVLFSILENVSKPEKLSSILQSLSIEQLGVFLGQCCDAGVSFPPEVLYEVLSKVDLKKCELITRLFQENYETFLKILRHLNPEKKAVILEALEDKHVEIMRDASTLGRVLQLCSMGRISELLDNVLTKNPSLLSCSKDYADFLQELSGEKQALLFPRVSASLQASVTTPSDVGIVFNQLSQPLKNTLFPLLEDKICALASQDVDAFKTIYKAVDKEFLKEGLPRILGNLAQTISSLEQYLSLASIFDDDEPRNFLFEQCQEKISTWSIETPDEALALLKFACVSDDRRYVFPLTFKDKQQEIVFPMVMAALPGFVQRGVLKHPFDVYFVSYLKEEQRFEVFSKLVTTIPGLIKDARDFADVQRYFNDQKYEPYFNKMLLERPQLISSHANILSLVTSRINESVDPVMLIERMKQYSSWPQAFYQIIPHLSVDEFKLALDELPNVLTNALADLDHLMLTLNGLSKSKCDYLLLKMSRKDPNWINRFGGLLPILSRFNLEQKNALFPLVKDSIVKNIEKDPSKMGERLLGWAEEHVQELLSKVGKPIFDKLLTHDTIIQSILDRLVESPNSALLVLQHLRRALMDQLTIVKGHVACTDPRVEMLRLELARLEESSQHVTQGKDISIICRSIRALLQQSVLEEQRYAHEVIDKGLVIGGESTKEYIDSLKGELLSKIAGLRQFMIPADTLLSIYIDEQSKKARKATTLSEINTISKACHSTSQALQSDTVGQILRVMSYYKKNIHFYNSNAAKEARLRTAFYRVSPDLRGDLFETDNPVKEALLSDKKVARMIPGLHASKETSSLGCGCGL